MVRRFWQETAVKQSIILFIVLRLFLTGWAVLVILLIPIPNEPDNPLRPYFGQPILRDGVAGYLLGPWQRFDTLHYTRIAAQGYAEPSDSVFPPLYPLAIRTLSFPFGNHHTTHMAAAIVIANLACLGLFILLHKVTAAEIGEEFASRTLIYYALFPAAFFLFAPYTETLFLLLALASIWMGRNGRFGWAGLFGLLASLTRLTGWVLVIPLAYEFWRQWLGHGPLRLFPERWTPRLLLEGFAIVLPGLGTAVFLLYRWLIGLPPLADVYMAFWYQRTGIPGADLLRALNTMFLGGPARQGEFTLWFDFFCVILLLVTTILAFRRLGITWGLYSSMMLLFMLLPTSELKPLYSFSRYTLAFFPTFMIMAQWGKNQWPNRLILYSSILLYLWFSGQFFIWGWVA